MGKTVRDYQMKIAIMFFLSSLVGMFKRSSVRQGCVLLTEKYTFTSALFQICKVSSLWLYPAELHYLRGTLARLRSNSKPHCGLLGGWASPVSELIPANCGLFAICLLQFEAIAAYWLTNSSLVQITCCHHT